MSPVFSAVFVKPYARVRSMPLRVGRRRARFTANAVPSPEAPPPHSRWLSSHRSGFIRTIVSDDAALLRQIAWLIRRTGVRQSLLYGFVD
jgi:hypothetical protein